MFKIFRSGLNAVLRIRRLCFRGSEAGKGFSIICVYNNRKKLDDYLIKSLERQTFPYELITVNSGAENFQSAAPLLNQAAKKAKHDYLMFVHQDVALVSNHWLANVQKDLRFLYRLGAAGVAGASKNGLAASVCHGNPPYFVGSKRLNKPVRVQTLDGCLMIVTRKVFERVSFDEKVSDSWYLYVADYCLDLARLGYRNYVLPHQIYHESTGPSDPSIYQKTLKNIIEKHRKLTKTIYTTVGVWKTR